MDFIAFIDVSVFHQSLVRERQLIFIYLVLTD